jgi:hypothetical protein
MYIRFSPIISEPGRFLNTDVSCLKHVSSLHRLHICKYSDHGETGTHGDLSASVLTEISEMCSVVVPASRSQKTRSNGNFLVCIYEVADSTLGCNINYHAAFMLLLSHMSLQIRYSQPYYHVILE